MDYLDSLDSSRWLRGRHNHIRAYAADSSCKYDRNVAWYSVTPVTGLARLMMIGGRQPRWIALRTECRLALSRSAMASEVHQDPT